MSRRSFFTRRTLLRGLGTAAAAWPVAHLLGHASPARALGEARRFLVFYFPDGIAGRSQDGDASLFPAQMAGGGVRLSEILEPLRGMEDRCVFLNGLSMGPADEGSHPGGAKKLLTAVDGGYGTSIDQVLAGTVGAGHPTRHLYCGVQANVGGGSGDKFISYVSPGITTAPDDDPLRIRDRIFTGGGMPMGGPDPSAADRAILSAVRDDVTDLRGALGTSERIKLDLHLDALNEVDASLTSMGMMMGSCTTPDLGVGSLDAAALYAPESFAAILRAQIDLTVTAMACGLTRVGVIQGSHHTSELIMSRIMGTPMYTPGYDMRSHQASHYGSRHDRSGDNTLFNRYVQQRVWWVSQFRYLLDQLAARPEADGTMLDYSVVLLCSEVSDGNTHLHGDMPFVLAGGGGGSIAGGRVMELGGRRHGDMLVSICQAMGHPIDRFGDASSGPIPGLAV
ncbi:MAG: DUF1552 domain-containing protein [Deltaproteobacteria bacterium]|nr:DUF1552 domain-containing protein [Deltaproteobacteria bacterium]